MARRGTESWKADESALLHALPTGVLVADTTGRILFANQRAAAILQQDSVALRGAPIERYLAPVASLERLSETEGRPRLEPACLPGETIGFRLSPFQLETGESAYAIVFQDITAMERRRREKDRLIQLAGMGEARAASPSGASLATERGDTPKDGLWLDLVWRMLAQREHAEQSEQSEAAEAPTPTKGGGATTPAEDEALQLLQPVLDRLPHHVFARDHDGRFILTDKKMAASYGLTGEGLEGLTEERRLAAAVEAAARDWRETFDAMSAAMMVIAADGTVLRANRTSADWLGLPVASLPGKRWSDLGTREPWRRAAELADAARRSSGGLDAEVSDPDSGGAWEIRADATRAGDGTVILAIRDVTATVEMRESARRNESLAALGSVVAGVAHEIRNPMTAIGAHIEALAMAMGSGGGEDESIVALRAEVKRLGHLLEELLEYGRPRASNFERVSLVDVVRSAVAACRHQASRSGVALEVEDAGTPTLSGDPARLRRAFVNLVENAVQNTPAGGTVTASVSAVDQGKGQLIRCQVADTGQGFKTSDLGRVFEPFFTRRPGGIGLGLPIVRRIFWDHGGSVEITNRPEGGALVLVSFLVESRA